VWVSEYVCSGGKQLPSGSCLWPMCLELGSLCVRLCTISGPSPGPGREVGHKDGHLSASHPKVIPPEWGDQLVVVLHNGRPSPQAGRFYWDRQGQSGRQHWGAGSAWRRGMCICKAASFGHAPRAQHPASPAGRTVCAVQSVGLTSAPLGEGEGQ